MSLPGVSIFVGGPAHVISFDAIRAVLFVEFALAVLLMAALVVLQRQICKSRREARDLKQVSDELSNVMRNEAILREVAEHANDGLVYQDMTARILWANAAYCRTMGFELHEIQGRRPQEFCYPAELKPSEAEIERFHYSPENSEFGGLIRRQNIRKNGERFWNEFNLSLVEPNPGEHRVVLVSRDVTQQVRREHEIERAKRELHTAAHHDALTGLKNRSAFLAAVDDILTLQKDAAKAMGLLYIDLDHFKAVNDSHGHAAGDCLLLHVARAIQSAKRSQDIACRMGGDEFVMACPDVDDFDTLQMLADSLLDLIRTPVQWQDLSLECGASIGLALSDDANATAEDLIRSADFALYEAKVPGAAHVARYDAELHARQEAENALMEEFIEALDNDGMGFNFQPILDARTGMIRSFETLARWTRKNGETVPPDRFLPFASRLNRLADIDFAAIRATTSLVAEFHGKGHQITGAFNTSSDALAHPDFMDILDSAVDSAGLGRNWLVAEVLETTFFGSDTTNSVAAARINELREHNFSVYLDDFGVGYAGLAHLGQLSVNGIKLDRSLVANVATDRSARIIATSILRLCDELGVGTLAEGIEAADQADYLTQLGCFRLQGFGIARPMTRDAILDLVEAGEPIRIGEAEPTTLVRSA